MGICEPDIFILLMTGFKLLTALNSMTGSGIRTWARTWPFWSWIWNLWVFPPLAEKFLAAYVRHSHDPEAHVLMNFYKCYRAMVRFKVNCIRLREEDVSEQEHKKLLEQTGKYLALADSYADGFSRPRIWIIFGMPASGKSSLAGTLSRVLKCSVR